MLRDGASYAYPNASTDEPDAAVFAKDNLRINGTGTLEVTGNFNNGIGSKDDLVIESGTIRVTATNHGIRGRDSLTVTGGTLDITAGNDGLQSNNDEDADKGWISLQGGTFNITSARDGIQADTKLTVAGRDVTIRAGGGYTASGASAEESYKGLKAGGNLDITSGSIRIDSLDDAIHSNSNITVSGGKLELASGDDGIHADYTVTISGGEINITDSFEGIEGSIVEIQDGVIDIVSSDDGLNAAGSSDNSEGQFGRDRFAQNDNWYIQIDGGRISVTASGDGIDSNGNLYMNGGTLLVSGPASGYNPAIDYDWGTFEFTGGVLAAAGGSGMASAPSEGSTQPALMVYFDSVQPEGTLFSVLDANGKVVIAFLPPSGYENMVISCPEFKDNQSFMVYTGGTISGEGQDGFYLNGTLSGGTKLFDITLSDATTYVDNTGTKTGNRMRDWGNWGR